MCHMTLDVINYVNMGIKRTVLIRQIDLSGSEPSFVNEIKGKMKKTEIPTFVFVTIFLCKMFCRFRNTKTVLIKLVLCSIFLKIDKCKFFLGVP